MIDAALFADLGIPVDYGRDPYRPAHPEATDLEDVELNVIGRMQRLAPDAARAWRAMKAAAHADAVELLLVSGFRSVQYQVELFRRKLASGHDIAAILKVNAAPGYSEHHTGEAVDIATPGSRPLTEEFEATAAFRWLQQHAVRYGFALPYRRDNVYGIAYEPWHWSRLTSSERESTQ